MSESEKEFEFIWKNFVVSIIERAASEISSEFINECDLTYSFYDFDEYKKNIANYYKEKREWLKAVYMPHSEKPLLDAHKLGGVLCRSLIANKPFYFDCEKAEKYVCQKFDEGQNLSNVKWFVSNIYVNYKVAFYASLGYIYTELLGKYRVSEMKDYYDELNNNGTLFFYEVSDNHESFEDSAILALQKNDILGRKFDYLSYAILLFQLEKHTDYVCRNIIDNKKAY